MQLKLLFDSFNKIREEMEATSLKYGLTDPKVLEYSRQLDKLHNTINTLRYSYHVEQSK